MDDAEMQLRLVCQLLPRLMIPWTLPLLEVNELLIHGLLAGPLQGFCKTRQSLSLQQDSP